MANRVHITSAIHYSNGPPHLGHAYEDIAADAYARQLRRRVGAKNLTFITGTDEHGQKNRDAAIAANLSPKAFADKISTLFRETFDTLAISYTNFVRTTDPAHEAFVQRMLAQSYQNGDITFRDYEGLYCIGCERFYTEKELIDGKICPEHNTPVQFLKESNYFLNLEKYRSAIRAHMEKHADFIRPERYRNEAMRMLDEPLADLCISRPKARLDWGIELPFDDKYVTYVWYDAFWAYVSELPDTSDESLREILPVTEHFIGKDILKTHAVYWPAMLMSVGLPLYRCLNVHGFLNWGGARMSKSSGNRVDPTEMARQFGPEVLRYFVLREFVYGLDGDFTEDRLIERYNAELANNLGNLASRVLRMAQSYCGSEVKVTPGKYEEIDSAIVTAFTDTPARVASAIEDLAFNRALEAIAQALDPANKYIVITEPFKMSKDPAAMPRVEQILANLLEALRVTADMIEPFMPAMSAKLADLLNVDEETLRKPYGEGLKPGHRVKEPVALFPRIEKAKKLV